MDDISYHRPVLLAETMELLAPRAGALIVDATCGGGGHTEEILRTGADVLALDQDPEAIEHAKERLASYGGRVTLRQVNFRNAGEVLDQLGIVHIGGALMDLGVSARQLENAERGFSIIRNGPLDMRMDQSQGPTAAELLDRTGEEELANVIFEYGEERYSRRIARSIVEARRRAPITTTGQLAQIVRRAVPRRGYQRIDPATRTFQAIRIWVNRELDQLEVFIADACARLPR